MKLKFWVKLLIGLAILFSVVITGNFVSRFSFKQEKVLGISLKQTQPELFFPKELFFQGVRQAQDFPKSFSSPVIGGVVPHHSTASYLIANFFKELSKQKPKTIILLGPNHENLGVGEVVTGNYNWETSFGLVQTDTQIINKLVEKKLAKVDDLTLTKEHSIGTLVPYIKYYLPETKVVPLIFHSSFDQEDARILGNYLSGLLNEETVLVASVDFSHYLSYLKANEKDQITLEIMKNLNLPKLFELNSDYLDSKEALGTLLVATSKKNAILEVIDHSNSFEILNKDGQTTSYFVLGFKL